MLLDINGNVYFIIRRFAVSTNQSHTTKGFLPTSNVAPNSCEVIFKTMSPEEQKALNTLIAHQSKYLQKYLEKEAQELDDLKLTGL